LLLGQRKAEDRKEISNVFYDYTGSTEQDSDIMEHHEKQDSFAITNKPLIYLPDTLLVNYSSFSKKSNQKG
jgi:hypothetical protein